MTGVLPEGYPTPDQLVRDLASSSPRLFDGGDHSAHTLSVSSPETFDRTRRRLAELARFPMLVFLDLQLGGRDRRALVDHQKSVLLADHAQVANDERMQKYLDSHLAETEAVYGGIVVALDLLLAPEDAKRDITIVVVSSTKLPDYLTPIVPLTTTIGSIDTNEEYVIIRGLNQWCGARKGIAGRLHPRGSEAWFRQTTEHPLMPFEFHDYDPCCEDLAARGMPSKDGVPTVVRDAFEEYLSGVLTTPGIPKDWLDDSNQLAGLWEVLKGLVGGVCCATESSRERCRHQLSLPAVVLILGAKLGEYDSSLAGPLLKDVDWRPYRQQEGELDYQHILPLQDQETFLKSLEVLATMLDRLIWDKDHRGDCILEKVKLDKNLGLSLTLSMPEEKAQRLARALRGGERAGGAVDSILDVIESSGTFGASSPNTFEPMLAVKVEPRRGAVVLTMRPTGFSGRPVTS